MFLSRISFLSKAAPSVNSLSSEIKSNAIRIISLTFHILDLFQKCLISSTPAFNKQLTTPQSLDVLKSAEEKHPVKQINQQIETDKTGRLFAIVHLCGHQFKVTAGDTILVEGYWPPRNSDQIRLEKVLLCGGQDFTLIGRPILQKGLVDVQATVIEKSLSHTRTHFKFKKRKQYRRLNFYRNMTTMLRINSVEIKEPVEGRSVKIPGIESIFY